MPEDGSARTLILLGALFAVGLATDFIGRRTPLPRVTLLLLFGVVVGPVGFDLLAGLGERWFPTVADIALVMVGFLLGGRLTPEDLGRSGRNVLIVSTAVVVATIVIVPLGLWAMGFPIVLALMLGGIATATDPAATVDVVAESAARGPFSETLLGIVTVDDAFGLLAFSFLISIAELIDGSADVGGAIVRAGYEIGGALFLGLLLGVPVALLTGRLRPGEPTQFEALAAVFICGGIALWAGVSFLLSAMVLGAVVVNFAYHHNRPFHEIEGIEHPFLILFFVLAGASLDLTALGAAGLLGAGYVVFRVAARVAGGWVGCAIAGTPPSFRRWMGLALLPQAGVALGMTVVAAHHFPEATTHLMPVVIATTIFFEAFGPILAKAALRRTGEANGT